MPVLAAKWRCAHQDGRHDDRAPPGRHRRFYRQSGFTCAYLDGAPLTFDQSTSNGGGRAIAHGRLPMPAKAFPRSFHEGRKKRGNLAWREITRWSESDLKSRRCADGANLDMVGVTGSIPVVPTILRSRSERRMPRRSPWRRRAVAARATAAQTTFSIRGKSNCAA
jgi:hypothetical protein